ncbi:TRAP transporter substrate-binding protein DctP [Roseibium aggregatum]|uniref:TRAP transporter substrate-binding protein DctP n=1 Tax=Roseibium aggregatum TaxID=187304 RepID=A0A939EE86_9HYPH|nr:TRAP transporter substrate-binding protein DctP [Roseibium aggregatum]MBN9670523.1 TRAP transporter substrate-binding protein DctP [Roseibium aggregatum]
MISFRAIVTSAAVLGVSGGVAAAQDYTMRLSHQFPPTHHTAVRMQQFEKDVEAETGGAVDVQIFGAAQLYNPKQHHAAVAAGEIESAIILNLQWGGTIPEMAVTLIPYLMSSPQAQQAFMGSEAASLLDDKMLEKGIRNIGWIVDTNDLIFTSSKEHLDEPSDFEGIKIRGLTPLFNEGLVALGATPVNMPGSETYQALQTGVIDAGVTGVAAAYSRKFYEVQGYGTATPMFLAFDNLVVNPAWWDGLPEEVKSGIQRAADKAVESSIITIDGIRPEDIENLKSVGMDARVLTDEQMAAMRDIMQPAVTEAFLKETGEDGKHLLGLLGQN